MRFSKFLFMLSLFSGLLSLVFSLIGIWLDEIRFRVSALVFLGTFMIALFLAGMIRMFEESE